MVELFQFRGYENLAFRFGWQDFDFWCKLIEHGLWGVQVPEILARYRVHKTSMLAMHTDVPEYKKKIIEFMQERHSWLDMAPE